MANVKFTLLPLEIVDVGDELKVFAQVNVDGGNYVTGGVQAAWDYATAPNAALKLGQFRKTSLVHASRPPMSAIASCGNPADEFFVIPVAGSPLPKIGVLKSADGTEETNGAPLPANTQSPVYPHTIALFYKKNI